MSIKFRKITGRIRVKTGLRIGGSKDNINIGGIDNVIIRNPADDKPYIPGSSIKGKMRFLMEWKLDKVDKGKGNVHNCSDPDCLVCGLFGSSQTDEKGVPTRLIVRDAMLVREPEVLIEEKVENTINRLTGRAKNGGLRTMERVVPGAEFEFEIILRLFDGDDENKWLGLALKALALLQNDYLGGSGSRGYGKIVFVSSDNKESAVDVDGKVEELPKLED